jgi:hypothetical protein
MGTGTLYADGTVDMLPAYRSVRVGDSQNDIAMRGFVTLSLDGIPAGAKVESAVLRLFWGSTNNNPFDDFGVLLMDHVDLRGGLDLLDWGTGTLAPGMAAWPRLPDYTDWGYIDVTSAVQRDLAAGRSTSSFRFYFTNTPSRDGVPDLIFIDNSPNYPQEMPSARVVFSR